MDQVLGERQLSSEAGLKVELKGGKLLLSVAYDGAGVDGALNLTVDSDYFIDKLAAAIPGSIDDAVLGIVKAALKA